MNQQTTKKVLFMAIETFDLQRILQLAVKQVGKPAVYVSCDIDFHNEKEKQVWDFVYNKLSNEYDYETFNKLIGAVMNNELVFFDTVEEQYRFYRIFEEKPVYGSAIYACTFNKEGQCSTENT